MIHLAPQPLLTYPRQEFYVRFKGPSESMHIFASRLPYLAKCLQPRSKAVSGRYTLNCQTNTRIRAPASASSTGYSTPTLMSCTSTLLYRCVGQTPDTHSSGSVCLDVINQTWSPMYDMINIFEVFLPQLLRYPNPTDPLNGEAAALLMREPKSYDAKVKGA